MTSAAADRAATGTSALRSDIQGLRAVAVLLVVANHASVVGFSGGYVGVDVFFVISGYLITWQIVASVQRGTFTFTDFYVRRVRRILPASLIVIAVTVVGVLALLPHTLRESALRDAIATVFYVPNISFAIQGTDYLAETAPSPFRHFWSLGVEEQFYLLWPMLLILVWRLTRGSRRWLTLTVSAVVLASVGTSVLLTAASQPWAFFSLQSRAWELALGGLLVFASTSWFRRVPAWALRAGGWLGLACIAFAALVFDAQTLFPGYAAVLPAVGAAVIIFFGEHDEGRGPVAVLGTRPAVFIGNISYSLYLVHWPMLVLPTASMRASGDMQPWIPVALAIASLPVAWVLYKLVEERFRLKRGMEGQRASTSFVSTAAGTLVVAVLAVGALELAPSFAPPIADVRQTTETFPGAVPPGLRPSLAAVAEDVPTIYSDGCHLDTTATAVQRCTYGAVDSDVTVALFGDSHAAQWFPPLAEAGERLGYRIESYTKAGCPSVEIDMLLKGSSYVACSEWRASVIEHLVSTDPDAIVLANRAHYPDQPEGWHTAERWSDGIRDVLDRLPEAAATIVIADTPNMGVTPSDCLAVNPSKTETCSLARSDAIDSEWLRGERSAATSSGAHFWDFSDDLCDASRCWPIRESTLIYRDAHHLTSTFALEVSPVFEGRLSELLRG